MNQRNFENTVFQTKHLLVKREKSMQVSGKKNSWVSYMMKLDSFSFSHFAVSLVQESLILFQLISGGVVYFCINNTEIHAFITSMPKEKLCSELCYWLKYSTEMLAWKDAANTAPQVFVNYFPGTYAAQYICISQWHLHLHTGVWHLKMKSKNFSSKLHKTMDSTSSLYLHFSKLPLSIFWPTLKYIPMSDSPGWRLWMWLCKKE